MSTHPAHTRAPTVCHQPQPGRPQEQARSNTGVNREHDHTVALDAAPPSHSVRHGAATPLPTSLARYRSAPRNALPVPATTELGM